MQLSELTAYAQEKFHIREQHKWTDFPGISVLIHPNTGKWVALLMRQWDSDTGTEIQRCDIKCGRQSLSEISAPYLSLPFRMKGAKWVGVKFEDRTNPDVIFRLFDRAVYSEEERGYTFVLDNTPVKSSVIYPDTALPPAYTKFSVPIPEVPEKIRKMQRLYQYGNGSFHEKCRNFYLQGKFMEDYQDDLPWTGEYRRYFPTYHDLNIRQLRGYFTWRTSVRKGQFFPISASLAYLYVYELLNGIGADSPEDSLKKLKEFEAGFLDSRIGDPGMGKNLRRWMLEYAVLHGIPSPSAREYADPEILEKDAALAVLNAPEESGDEEIFESLCTFAGKKLKQSQMIKKEPERGKHLFAELWRYASKTCFLNDRRLFTACFGELRAYPWRPLANAVYWEEHIHPDTDYNLDECRIYHCRSGVWQEERYDNLYFNKKIFSSLLHEAERRFRKYLKTGHYLQENPDEAWAAAYAKAVIKADQQAKIEAAKPKITINLSHLEQIRQDALVTRDSLLIEEELEKARGDVQEMKPQKKTSGGDEQKIPPIEAPENPVIQDETEDMAAAFPFLDRHHSQILFRLLRGESAENYIKAHHLMPSVITDRINEAFFDEIGDTILECDGDTITIIEDYREDILQMLGGKFGSKLPNLPLLTQPTYSMSNVRQKEVKIDE